MLGSYRKTNQVTFLVIFALLGALVIWLIHSYLDIVTLSLMMVIILKPLYDWLLRSMPGRTGLATSLTVGVFFLIVIIPLWLAWQVIAGQLSVFLVALQEPGQITALIDSINATLSRFVARNDLISPTIQQQAQQVATSAASWVGGAVLNLGTQVADGIARLLIFLGILGIVLPHYAQIVQRLKRLSPLDDALDSLFLHKIKLTVRSMFVGIFVIALAQGLVCGLLFWLAGVPYTSVWTLIAVVTSLFPLGASLVALPIGIVELALGNYGAGAIILAGYIVVVSNLDSLLRPRLVPKEADLNFVLVLLSALGGLEVFGFFGVVYGPVLMVVFLTAVDVYEARFTREPMPDHRSIEDDQLAGIRAHAPVMPTPEDLL